MTRLEDLGYLRIHVDHHVLLSLELVVARVHPGFDPLGKDIANDAVDNVSYVLSWQLLELFVNWKVPSYLRIRAGKCLHVFN